MRILNEERPHISISQLTTYLQCPRMYYFQYILGIQWKIIPAAVAFGSAIHEAIEAINRSLTNGSVMGRDEAISVFNAGWMEKVESEQIDWKKSDESADLLSKGMELISIYHESFKASKARDVELEFRLPIIDPATGFLIESHDVVGKIDAISDGGTIVEIKTASKSPNQLDIDNNMQLTLYSWAYRFLYGEPEEAIKVISLIKTKEPQVQVIKTSRGEGSYTRLFKLIDNVIRAIDGGFFYCNPLNVWGCRNCQYISECESE